MKKSELKKLIQEEIQLLTEGFGSKRFSDKVIDMITSEIEWQEGISTPWDLEEALADEEENGDVKKMEAALKVWYKSTKLLQAYIKLIDNCFKLSVEATKTLNN